MRGEPTRSRVLIVEDEGIVAADIARCLENVGYEISGIAASAEGALKAAASTNPDLVLLDITIEGPVDGITAGREIYRRHQLPIIFLTAHGDRDTINRAKTVSPFAFLLKPWKPSELTNAIEIALSRHRAEKELKDRERFLAAAMDSIGDAVLTIGEDGSIRFMNHAAEVLTGCPCGQAIGRATLDVVNILEQSAGDRERFLVLLNLCAGPESDQDFSLQGPHAEVRSLRVRATTIVGSSSSVRFIIIEDTTLRRETERKLRVANQDLEQFAYSASHDLQEPIRNIAIYSQLISRDYSEVLDAAGRHFLGNVTNSAKRMEQLLKDLLAYTQAAQSPVEDDPESDASAALAEALSNLSGVIRETRAQVTYGRLPKLCVRTIELQQLFQNLIANALKYRRLQEVPRIHIAVADERDMWVFSVEDNGIGIAPEHRKTIFGVFKRLHEESKYPGTGIGLAICQKIVARHSGRIWVDSEVGKGSTFFFTLPRTMEISRMSVQPG